MFAKAHPTAVLICATVVMLALIAAGVRLVALGASATQFAAIFGTITTALPAIAAFITAIRAHETVQSVKKDTNEILNGAMQTKIETGVQKVLDSNGVTHSTPETQTPATDSEAVAEVSTDPTGGETIA